MSSMNRYHGWFATALASGGLALAEPDGPASLSVDLDRDGRPERIFWTRFRETGEGETFFQLKVLRADGSALWEGPKSVDRDHPLAFGDWDYGSSLPQLAADIDGDGAVELLAPAPQSDVSPTWYRVFRWTAAGFVPLKPGALMERPPGSGLFPWYRGEDYEGAWVSRFRSVDPGGGVVAEIMEYRSGATPRAGVAVLTGVDGGFRLTKWAEPLKPLADLPAPGDGSAPAGEGRVVYRARLSQADHVNSAGERLSGVSEILRQDRANYHRGRGDDEDGPDPLFGSLEARAGMERRQAVPVGRGESAWRRILLEGTPLVEVEVTPGELRVRLLE